LALEGHNKIEQTWFPVMASHCAVVW